MSKKLIAVASAAALALSAFVAMPAQAADFTVEIAAGATANVASTASVKTTPATHAAPENGEVEFNSSATGTAVRFTVSGTSTADVPTTVSAAGGVLLVENYLDADNKNVKLATGLPGLALKYKTSNNAVFYAYSTSTTPGTVTISAGGNTKVYYVAARVGNVYNVSATFPTFVASGGSGSVTAVITDVFGNAITGTNASSITVDNAAAFFTDNTDLKLTAVGAGIGATSPGTTENTTWFYSTTAKAWIPGASGTGNEEKVWVAAGNAGSVALRVDILRIGSDGESRFRDVGLPAPQSSAFSVIASGDLAKEVAALRTQVAALQAQLEASRPKATSVTKKRYNTLARKWNRANPTDRVKLKK